MIVETVIQLLTAGPDVAAIVDERVYADEAPDGATYPLLVVTKVAGPGAYTNDGDTGLEEARVQVDCYTDQGGEALITLRTAVRRRLSGFRGGAVSGSPCAISSVFCINDLALPASETIRTGPRLRRRMLEFRIWNREV